MYCKICGKQLPDGTIKCDACGAQTSYESNPGYNQANNTGYSVPPIEEIPSENVRLISGLAYFWILFFLPLAVHPGSSYGRFHANQGLILLIATVVAGIAVGILSGIFFFIPFSGTLLRSAVSLASFVLAIIGFINAYNNKKVPLPVIGTLFTFIK